MKTTYPRLSLLPIAGSSLLAVSSTHAANTGKDSGADDHTTTPGLLPTLPIAPTA